MRNVNLELRSLNVFGQLSDSTISISSVFIKRRYSDLQILSLLLEGLMLQQVTLGYNVSAWWYLALFSLSVPQRNPLIPSRSPKGANWQADVLQKGYCSQNTAVLFLIKSCGVLFILEYFYFLCTTYNHVLLTEIYFKEKKKIWKYSLKNTQKSLLIILYFYWSCLNV